MQASRSSTIVAWVFIVFGLLAVVGMFVQWRNGGEFRVSTSLLNFLIGVGLLRRENYARRLAFVSIGLGVVITMWALLNIVFSQTTPGIKFLGVPVTNTSLAVIGLLLSFATCAWQGWVLTRPEVKALYRESPPPFARRHGDTAI